jgi:hypothetical protein
MNTNKNKIGFNNNSLFVKIRVIRGKKL